MNDAADGTTPVYEDDDVKVIATKQPAAGCIVTFSSLNVHDQPFGRNYLEKSGISGVYFIAKWNHWWQPAGCRAAIAAAVQYMAASQPGPIMTYGSSMGGYGAALYSGRLDASTVLMLSPQYTPDPAKPPHETRWAKEAREITFLHDDMAAEISRTARKIVIYDTHDPDSRHAALFAAIPGTELFGTPFAGHPAGYFLLQTKLLQELVLGAYGGALDRHQYRDIVRRRRGESGNYWHRLGIAANRTNHPWGLDCLLRAVQARPSDAAILMDQANALLRARKFEEAILGFEKGVLLAPQAPAPLRGLSVSYRHLGDSRKAVAFGEAALALRPDSTDLRRVLVYALLMENAFGRAREIIRPAVAKEPDNVDNLRLLAKIDHLLQASEAGVDPSDKTP